MDAALTFVALGSFFSLVLCWIALPHGGQVAAPATSAAHAAPQRA